jgi:hypothetical protein
MNSNKKRAEKIKQLFFKRFPETCEMSKTTIKEVIKNTLLPIRHDLQEIFMRCGVKNEEINDFQLLNYLQIKLIGTKSYRDMILIRDFMFYHLL